LFHGAVAATLPYVLYKAATTEKYRAGMGERFGRFKREKLARLEGEGTGIWVHAVSVGETRAVLPLLKALRARRPEARILFSTTTRTGHAVAESECADFIDALVYFPLDFSWAVNNVIEKFKPSILIVTEKEIWPNLFKALNDRSVPVVVVNGNISERSYRRFLKFGFFFAEIFSKIDFFCAGSDVDYERAVALGVAKERAMVTGNLKFDQAPSGGCDIAVGLKKVLGLKAGELLFVAGSTHRGEDEIILTAFKELAGEFPVLRLAIAPRHPEKFGEVEGLIKKSGLSYARRSGAGKAPKKGAKKAAGKSGNTGGSAKIFLLDSMGELASLYGLSHICFVGGSLVPGIGGHNLLEPAGLGRPVLFGPYVHTCEATAELLATAGGGVMVSDGRELTAELKKLASDKKAREAMGSAARSVVEKNRGAVEKTLKVINGLLK
ncbi:MAG: 3-deoxy-D-manno-octulosonic acid transferase, partial [Thermodesulfobacteriota bacterium]